MSLGATYAQADPANLSSQEIYDRIMIQIEPDLVSHMIPLLEKIYANESEKERKARGERYKEAFALCSERVESIFGTWKEGLEFIKAALLSSMASEGAESDRSRLSEIEDFLNDNNE